MSSGEDRSETLDIAIIGMAGRFPKAKDIDAFWANLRDGVEGISFFDEEGLLALGVPPEVIRNPRFVKASPILEDIDRFDASFFGFSPRDAEIMDPQHRIFLECAHHALEDAGYDPSTYPGLTAVYAGTSLSMYLLFNLMRSPAFKDLEDSFQLMLGNDKDFLSTRVSYKLNLRGPSVDVQTGCSTSLVAIHFACQSLLSYQCDMALAGGVSIHVPQRTGYLYEEGGIVSPDGHCRAFAANAQGTIFGSGVGIVVLKRLDDALADGDTIHAVIKGSAINNDGALKIGYTAPSVDGQAEVIARAHAVADVEPETLTYIEAHGTGTAVGDPIEVAALAKAFRAGTQARQFCAIGSVKSSIGHLDAAAGIAGLLKTVLALKHRQIPATLHCDSLNPKIDFASSPFYVNTALAEWTVRGAPRRAGVSSFGIGGTNAHVILEEAPPPAPTTEERPWQLVVLSGKTTSALESATANLADHLERHPDLGLADVAYTLQIGRQAHGHRRILVCRGREEAIAALTNGDAGQVYTAQKPPGSPQLAFLFPGQGAQYPRMAQGLYEEEPLFREEVDRCAALLQPELDLDLRRLLFPVSGHEEDARQRLNQTALTQPALFVIEYALARFWMSLNVRPQAMIGHSIGEYVAACLAGVLSLEEALPLVVARGRMIQELPTGAMLSLPLPEDKVRSLLGERLSLAAVNGPSHCVVAGPVDAIEQLERQLAEAGRETRRIHTSHAFHSATMDAILEQFTDRVRRVRLQPPQIPYISNVSGTWVTAEEATDPRYWAAHLRQTVRFADGARALIQMQDAVMLEVGPGRTLSTLIRQQLDMRAPLTVASSLRHPQDAQPDRAFMLKTLGSLWLSGVAVDWPALHAHERRRRVPLPPYPYQRQRYWIDPHTRYGEQWASAPSQRPAELASEERTALHPRPAMRNAYVAPRNEREQIITGIWHSLLGIQEIGVHDDFFELGGHSILATQLASRLRDAFQVEIPLGSLFDTPTVAGLAAVVERHQIEQADQPESARRPQIPVLPRNASTFKLSFSQQRLWFLDQLEPGIAAYHISEVVRLVGPLDVAAFRRCLEEIVRRNESLRTTFTTTTDGEPAQVVAAEVALDVPITDLSDHSSARREAEAMRLAVDEANRPFDLATGPLLRVRLFQMDREEHLLLLTVHHIVADGWSMGVLIHEMVALYEAARAGRPSPLPALPVQYVDFSHWQREWLQGERLDVQLGYWRRKLTGSPPMLDLPTDRSRPALRTYRGARHFFALPPELASALVALSQREGVTLFMTLLAAYQILLQRYARQDDILVGSPIANRSRTEIEGLIGFFVNTLVLRGDLSGDPTVRNLLARVRLVAKEAYEHQDLPFEMLVEALQPERDLSRTPLFQVMFALQSTELPEREVAGLRLRRVDLDTQTAKFDLMLELYEGPGKLTGWLEYNSDLFEPATIARMTEHYRSILEGMVAHPEQRVSELDLLTDAERHRLLVTWNATRVSYPFLSLHGLVEAQVSRTPDAEAVVFEDQRLTYQELDRRANQLAHHLRALGVGPEARVGVFMERSIELVVALFGILKAGGAYVPLDPEYPADRLAFMREDAQVSVLLTQDRLLRALPPGKGQVIPLDTGWPIIAEAPARSLPDLTLPDQGAYIIYTSGSTGRPKGVINTHRGICNRLLWMQQAYRLTSADRVLQKTPFGFDVSVWEFFWPLLSGACLVVARPRGHRDSAYLARLIADERITTMHFVPSMLQVFLEEEDLTPCGSLRRIICSGEALPAALQERCLSRLDAELHNLYGPTEAAIDVSAWACRRGEDRRVPIGRPIANIQLYVLDRHGRLSPIGVPGELHIGGVGLARGYLDRRGLTAERFIPDPFSAEPGSRLYRTGDLVRLLADGTLDFLDRTDFQIKIRGFRVELGEIEAVLRSHPGVREAVVVVRGDGSDRKELAAYVVPGGEPAPAPGDLRAFLREGLPEYMVPGSFTFLSRMPLNASGKIDRRALPAPEQGRRESEVAYAAPRTELEHRIAAIWQEVLGIDRVGLNDNFFDLGGHSLRMVQVRNKIQPLLPRAVSIIELFQFPTISTLVAYLEKAEDRRAALQQSQSRAEARRESVEQLARGRQRPRAARKP